jgi:predicted nucleotidyltransferase
MPINNTQNPYVEKIKSIILAKIKGYSIRVYLFGSRANNTARPRSDVDVALFSPSTPLPPFLLSEIKDELEESDVPPHLTVMRDFQMLVALSYAKDIVASFEMSSTGKLIKKPLELTLSR